MFCRRKFNKHKNDGLLLLECCLKGNPLVLCQQLHAVICNLFFYSMCLKGSVHSLDVVIKWVILSEKTLVMLVATHTADLIHCRCSY